MLVLHGKSNVGNMLHVITGPESELFTDINGATILNITPVLMAMDGDKNVYLTVTRCYSEQDTVQRMKQAAIPHISSFEANKAAGSGPDPVTKDKPETHITGKCDYCDDKCELLPIPGFNICKVCAQIELGRVRQKSRKGSTVHEKEARP